MSGGATKTEQRERIAVLTAMLSELQAERLDSIAELLAPGPRKDGGRLFTVEQLRALLSIGKTTLYERMPDLVELRRGAGPDGGMPFFWLESDVARWIRQLPVAPLTNAGHDIRARLGVRRRPRQRSGQPVSAAPEETALATAIG